MLNLISKVIYMSLIILRDQWVRTTDRILYIIMYLQTQKITQKDVISSCRMRVHFVEWNLGSCVRNHIRNIAESLS